MVWCLIKGRYNCSLLVSLAYLFSLPGFVLCSSLYIIHSFIGVCRMWQFLAILRSFFLPLCCVLFPSTHFHQLVFHPSSLHLAIYFLVYFSALLFPNSYKILFWEFCFLPFSVLAQTNVIYIMIAGNYFSLCMFVFMVLRSVRRYFVLFVQVGK